jgi:hypothetical protein
LVTTVDIDVTVGLSVRKAFVNAFDSIKSNKEENMFYTPFGIKSIAKWM